MKISVSSSLLTLPSHSIKNRVARYKKLERLNLAIGSFKKDKFTKIICRNKYNEIQIVLNWYAEFADILPPQA